MPIWTPPPPSPSPTWWWARTTQEAGISGTWMALGGMRDNQGFLFPEDGPFPAHDPIHPRLFPARDHTALIAYGRHFQPAVLCLHPDAGTRAIQDALDQVPALLTPWEGWKARTAADIAAGATAFPWADITPLDPHPDMLETLELLLSHLVLPHTNPAALHYNTHRDALALSLALDGATVTHQGTLSPPTLTPYTPDALTPAASAFLAALGPCLLASAPRWGGAHRLVAQAYVYADTHTPAHMRADNLTILDIPHTGKASAHARMHAVQEARRLGIDADLIQQLSC